VLDNQGWLHTGDLGVCSPDGFIYIMGRSKSMILGPSGENIYPEEIESKLSNCPYIQEQLVISDNNRLVALVLPDFEKARTEGVSPLELESILEQTKKQVNMSLPKYAQIAEIKIQQQEFEKTPKQSIKRFNYSNINN
jgi:long-chain acyl-CoA synthetase